MWSKDDSRISPVCQLVKTSVCQLVQRSRASSCSADSQPARVSSEAFGSASGPPPAASFLAVRPARPQLQGRPLGWPSVEAKELRPLAIPHLLLRRRLPSRMARRAQEVYPRTAPLTRPSQAGAFRPALPQPGSRATSWPERNLKCWARCECLAPAPRLRLLACRHPSRGSVRLPPSPRILLTSTHIIYPPSLQLEMSSLSLLGGHPRRTCRPRPLLRPPELHAPVSTDSPAPGPREFCSHFL